MTDDAVAFAAVVLAQHALNPPTMPTTCACGDDGLEIEHPGHVAAKLHEAGLLALPALT